MHIIRIGTLVNIQFFYNQVHIISFIWHRAESSTESGQLEQWIHWVDFKA